MKSLLFLLVVTSSVDSYVIYRDVEGLDQGGPPDEPRYFNDDESTSNIVAEKTQSTFEHRWHKVNTSSTSPFIKATQHILKDISGALKQPTPPREVKIVLTEISKIAKQLLSNLQKRDFVEDQGFDQEMHHRRNFDVFHVLKKILLLPVDIALGVVGIRTFVEDVNGSDEPRTFLEAIERAQAQNFDFEGHHRNLDSSGVITDIKDTLLIPLKAFISFWDNLLGKRNFVEDMESGQWTWCKTAALNLEIFSNRTYWEPILPFPEGLNPYQNRRNLDVAGVITDIKDVALIPMKIIISFWDNLLGRRRGFAGDMDGEQLIRTLKEALEQVAKDPQNHRRNFDILDVITGIKDVVLTPPKLIISFLDELFGTRGFITDNIDKERIKEILESKGIAEENSDWVADWIAKVLAGNIPERFTDNELTDNESSRNFAGDWFSNWLQSIVTIIMKPSSSRFFEEDSMPRRREFWDELVKAFDDLGKSPIGRVIGFFTGADFVVEVVKEVVDLVKAPKGFIGDSDEDLNPEAVELLKKIDLENFDINLLSDTDKQDLITTFEAITIGLGHRNFDADSLLDGVPEVSPQKRQWFGSILSAITKIFKKPVLDLLRHAFKLITRGKTVLKTIGKGAKEALKGLVGRMKASKVPRILEKYGDVTTMTEDWDGVEMKREMQYVNTEDGKGIVYTLEDKEGTKIEEGFVEMDENPLEEIFKKKE